MGLTCIKAQKSTLPLAGFEALVSCSPGLPVWLSLPPSLSPVPSLHRTLPAPPPTGDLMDFQANELGVGKE